jgi:hypothetical protein
MTECNQFQKRPNIIVSKNDQMLLFPTKLLFGNIQGTQTHLQGTFGNIQGTQTHLQGTIVKMQALSAGKWILA